MTPTLSYEQAQLLAAQQGLRHLAAQFHGPIVASGLTLGAALAPYKSRRQPEGERPLKILTAEELLNLPSRPWLVEGRIVAEGLHLVFGPSGAGKSALCMDLAVRCCAGLPVFGVAGSRPLNVLYLAAEGRAMFAERMRSAAQANGLEIGEEPLKSRLRYCLEVPAVSGGASLANLDALRTALDEQRGFGICPDLVLFDTYSDLSLGTNENDSSEQNVVLAKLTGLASDYSCALMAIHHSGKDSARGIRGASAILARADVAFEVEGLRNPRGVSLYKGRDTATGMRMYFDIEPLGQTVRVSFVDKPEKGQNRKGGGDLPSDEVLLETIRQMQKEPDAAVSVKTLTERMAIHKRSALKGALDRLADDSGSPLESYKAPSTDKHGKPNRLETRYRVAAPTGRSE